MNFYTTIVILFIVRGLDSSSSGEATNGVQEYGTEFRRRIPSGMSCRTLDNRDCSIVFEWSALTVNSEYFRVLKTFSLPTDAHNVKKHRVIKTF